MTFLKKFLLGGLLVGTVLWLWPKPAWASPQRVLVLGDSLVASPGFLPALQEGFGPGVVVKQVSLAGCGTSKILDTGLKTISRWGPDVVVVLAGVNDLASGRGSAHVKSNLDTLYRSIEALGSYVFAVQLTPWSDHIKGRLLQAETKEVNNWISAHSVPVAVVYTDHIGHQGKDGLHLRSAGGQELAESVLCAFGS